MALLEQYGADAVRYWAASGRPGTDTAFDEGQMKIGRRLAIKILNASKFVLGVIGDDRPPSRRRGHRAARPVDARPASPTLVDDATAAFDGYDYARALERTERFFWGFCDDYLELVKGRAYGGDGDEAARVGPRRARRRARHAAAAVRAVPAVRHRRGVVVVARGLGPPGAVARRPPTSAPPSRGADPLVLAVAVDVLAAVRRAKSDAKRSMRADVEHVIVTDTTARLAALASVEADVLAAGNVAELTTATTADGASVDVRLSPADPAPAG